MRWSTPFRTSISDCRSCIRAAFGSDAELALAALIEGDATYTMIELLKKDQPKAAAMLQVPLEKSRNLQNAFLYAQGPLRQGPQGQGGLGGRQLRLQIPAADDGGHSPSRRRGHDQPRAWQDGWRIWPHQAVLGTRRHQAAVGVGRGRLEGRPLRREGWGQGLDCRIPDTREIVTISLFLG